MKKDKLLDIISDLPVNMREQLAEEIYQGLDAADLQTGNGSRYNYQRIVGVSPQR